MKFIKIFLGLCLLLALPKANVMGQNTAPIKIKATIVGTNKQPISGAVIKSSDEIGKATVTDASGTFIIEVPKNEMLSIVAPGFKTKYITSTGPIGEL